MKELVEYIAKVLVDDDDAVRVTEIEGEKTSVIELSVARGDIGKIVGRQGRIANAIRIILGAAGMKKKKRIHLEIIE